MNEKINPEALNFANNVMGMNREGRRKFSKENKMKFTIAGTNKPLIKDGNPKRKKTS